jgi:hypothetical protein
VTGALGPTGAQGATGVTGAAGQDSLVTGPTGPYTPFGNFTITDQTIAGNNPNQDVVIESVGISNVTISGSFSVAGELYAGGNVFVSNQTLIMPMLMNAADDFTAASLGVPLYGVYVNGNVLQIRMS